ncbi:MAG TPA: hypothetical protein VNM14_11550 [Planctomycetota bacterium]|jgi:hypothetical protein|nr:hypothetical protein [Planctomycetota bacterium]
MRSSIFVLRALQGDLTQEQILDRVKKTYAACTSYRDSGIVKTVFIKADGNETKEKPFKTAFVRPDRFRFEYKDSCRTPERSGHIVWCKGKEVQTWRDVQPWTCKVNREGSFLEERADTAAHAICLAALKGVGQA